MNYKSADKWTNEEIKELSILLSHSSCAIEGNKLSLDEVRKLLSDNDDYGDLLVLYNKILKYHNDIVDFIYEEMDGKLYCDRLYINDLLEKEIILPNYSVPYDMVVKWYETYHTMMRFLQHNDYYVKCEK